MTGSAADADDLVQETLARALERPPLDLTRPLKPWLTRVAVNLSREQLRARRSAAYVGPWLPSPIETPVEELPLSVEPHGTEGRYDLLESASIAFLLALEVLSPKQRAVLLLREVFDQSVHEVAHVLGLGEGNVKVIHHRARHALERYHREWLPPSADSRVRHREAMEQFLGALLTNDLAAAQQLLAESVVLLSDGGGEFFAAGLPIVGAKKVATVMGKLLQHRGPPEATEVRMLNGLPAVVADYATAKAGESLHVTLALQLDRTGKIAAIYSTLATRKLTHVPPAMQADA